MDMDCSPDWSGMLPELLVKIACHLPLIEDFTAFRGVCTNWRAAGAVKARLFKGLGKVPLLMLSEEKDGSDEREFYSFSKKKIVLRMPVPEAKGKNCIAAGFGWILTLSDDSLQGPEDELQGSEVSLFNPFSSAVNIELPNIRTFPKYEEVFSTHPEFKFIKRGVLSANPSSTSDFTIFVIAGCWLGLWRNGDENWTWLDKKKRYECICYYKEKMYAIDTYGEIQTWDPHGTNPTMTRLILQGDYPIISRTVYMVESSDGKLLIILRKKVDKCTQFFYLENDVSHFGVMRVDLVKMECKLISGIGKDAVFLGDNTPVSLTSTDYPGVLKPNCIYYTDDCWTFYGGQDMGIFNLEDGSIERFDVESFSIICPPLWIFPSF